MNQRIIDSKSGLDYGELFNQIAYALNMKLYTMVEKRSGVSYYVIKGCSLKSKQILRNYFDTYPLLTSKFLDYKNWCAIDNIMQKKNYSKHFMEILQLKNQMNLKRTNFNWCHLEKFNG